MPGDRRVGAHPAGVRAGVAVADPLVVAGRSERDRAAAVGEREQRHLLALQQLLDHERLAEPGDGPAAPRPGTADPGRRRRPFPRRARRPSRHREGGRPPGSRRSERRPRASRPWRTSSIPRSCAASRPGPKTRTPAWRSSSATPDTSGASGPTTTRSASSARARSSRPSPSSARTGWHSPRPAIPGFPGAAWSSSRRELCRSFHASACSRPPEPIKSTLTCARVYCGRRRFQRARTRRQSDRGRTRARSARLGERVAAARAARARLLRRRRCPSSTT